MKTLGARLALSYSLASTITVIAVLAVGFFLLNGHLIRSTDLLNAAEGERLKSALGPAFASASPARLNAELASIDRGGPSTFFVQVSMSGRGNIFRSPNLAGQSLSGGPPGDAYSLSLPGLGGVRVRRILLDGGEIEIATSMELARQVTDGYAEMSIVLVSLTLLASLAAGLGLSHFALRPLRQIQDTAHRIGSDNLGERIPVAEVEDEMSDLAQLLNDMFDRLESSFQQIRRFTAEASHELKTPLSLVRLHAEKLLGDGDLTAAQEDALQSQLEEITRLNQIIEEMLFLSKAEAGAIVPQMMSEDPRTCLEAFVADAGILAEHASVRLTATMTGDQTISFDRKWIRQVLLNLVGNALRASPEGSLVTIKSKFTIQHWRLEIEDEGPGVPAEDRERIFERFVRLGSAQAAMSTGLGLAICRSMIEMQGGSIRVESGERKGGLCVVCELPMASSRDPETPPLSRKSSVISAIVPD